MVLTVLKGVEVGPRRGFTSSSPGELEVEEDEEDALKEEEIRRRCPSHCQRSCRRRDLHSKRSFESHFRSMMLMIELKHTILFLLFVHVG